jgi:nucleotidyltransferase/DNA polymerase involved in DNA repair
VDQGPSRVILHLDMDAFYAAVEQRDRPELVGLPVIIGADPKGGTGRGVVSTASYEARRFGVGSAMAVSTAFRLCPTGVFIPPDMDKYAKVSQQIMQILRRVTDLVEPLSIDEAFLDVTGSRRASGTGEQIARRLKEDIVREVRLTASVGVASCKLVAKIASDLRKPDGLVVVPPGTESAFLAPLPVRRLWGVGPKMEEVLLRAGIASIGALASADPARLEHRLGTHGHDLQQLARGIDPRPVLAEHPGAKSVGQEHTFAADTADVERLRATLLALADAVAARLRSQELEGRTVTLKYRDASFRTRTRATTLDHPTASGKELFDVAWRLFLSVHETRKVRLVGIYASGFDASAEQLDLFRQEGPSPADRARDAIVARFGDEAITRASLLGRREKRTPNDPSPREPAKGR